MNFDSRPATTSHIRDVQKYISRVVMDLIHRGNVHDASKLVSPEVEAFDRLTPKLKELTFGSQEYKASLAELGPALEHHYANNRHHPQHWGEKGVSGMNLLDIVEMLCDWKAATLRHDDGDIRQSIEINQKRFGYSDELKQIFLNTLPMLEALD